MNKALVPEDFDWEYYVNAHPDIYRAGIKTQKMAEYHYVVYGKKENRQYKSPSDNIISSIINNQTDHDDINYINEIILFTPWYLSKDSSVNQNNIQCLKNNLNNQYIKYICLLLENENIPIDNDIKNHKKLHIYNINKRLTYADWYYYSIRTYKPYIKILANTDIYFDQTIHHLLTKNFNPQIFYGITRKDLNQDGLIVESSDFYGDEKHPTNPIYSQDCWIFQKPIQNINADKIDLNLGLGNCDRLLKKHISEECNVSFINLYPQINAIHLDHRKNKKRNSYNLNSDLIDYQKYSITNYIKEIDLKPYSNKLEAICLLLTGKELDNMQFDKFIQRLVTCSNEENYKYAQKLDFNIATQYTIDNKYKKLLNTYFKKCNIITLNIPKNYDKYELDEPSDLYGTKAGPNWCFFQTLNSLKNYNTTLLLESDVFFNQNWLYKIHNYCLNSGDFWISGSKNYGYNKQSFNDISNEHINGGVALYATGNNLAMMWLRFCENILPEYVKYRINSIPYDYLLYMVLKDFYNFDIQNRNIWKFIANNYISNNLICNISSKQDQSVTLKEFMQKYNFSILHKKGDY